MYKPPPANLPAGGSFIYPDDLKQKDRKIAGLGYHLAGVAIRSGTMCLKVATRRWVMPKTVKNWSQNDFASASSLVSCSHSFANWNARARISFQLSAMLPFLVYAYNIAKRLLRC